ncbi:MAG: zinc ribbon domain-containing protein, partial [Proteobacteria bacterium]|nr:zinc ribbon domain-containing protein [Pseudomonadota bacterium]
MFCPNCGFENEENSQFCGNCGNQLSVSLIEGSIKKKRGKYLGFLWILVP